MHILGGDPGKRVVVFEWSTQHGECYDCGAPAAYKVETPARTVGAVTVNAHEEKLCSVCAALCAASGEKIAYLF